LLRALSEVDNGPYTSIRELSVLEEPDPVEQTASAR
jgi:hypothetical protein